MVDRAEAIAWYRRNRDRSRQLFDMIAPGGEGVYYDRPIALRHPIVFYEGHLPAFSFNTLVRKALGGASIDARLESLFARGIDPHEASTSAVGGATAGWPSRAEVRAFADEADRRVIDALSHAELDRPGHPLLHRAEAVYTILEHEPMHHETLLYMWHRLPLAVKQRPDGYAPLTAGAAPAVEQVEVPGGAVSLGARRDCVPFGWDNEFDRHTVAVEPFAIDRHNVTNAAYRAFVDAGGYRESQWWAPADWEWVQREQIAHPLFWEPDGSRWWWRGLFDRVPLPDAWPVYVGAAEASAYARWRGGRLPTEAEFHRAAFGSPDGERRHPWGADAPSHAHGNFDFASWDPVPVGRAPAGRSAWGVEDLVGNGWEWTRTPFAPFPGFRPMASYPEYSADFFDGEHVVMKGASPATAAELVRPSFRNWFRRRYPYVYATFRCVQPDVHRG